jgi:hypothetical protein
MAWFVWALGRDEAVYAVVQVAGKEPLNLGLAGHRLGCLVVALFVLLDTVQDYAATGQGHLLVEQLVGVLGDTFPKCFEHSRAFDRLRRELALLAAGARAYAAVLALGWFNFQLFKWCVFFRHAMISLSRTQYPLYAFRGVMSRRTR